MEKSRALISDVVCTGVLRAVESNKGKKLFYSKGRIHLEFISKNIFKSWKQLLPIKKDFRNKD